ncbi:hypothetical protein QUA99_25240 [Microcoleus sp. F10-B2]
MFDYHDDTGFLNNIIRRSDWWKIHASDIHPWVQSLTPAAKEWASRNLRLIGTPWDGRSDVSVGFSDKSQIISAEKIRDVLSRLNSYINYNPELQVQPVNAENVRLYSENYYLDNAICIDIDMTDYILPIGITYADICRPNTHSEGFILENMIELIQRARSLHKKIVDKETRFRRTLEEVSVNIGNGVLPVWLRRNAISLSEDRSYFVEMPYVMVLVTLDQNLLWFPEGHDSVKNVKTIRSYYNYIRKTQCDRLDRLMNIAQSESIGMVSDVALATIDHLGLDLVATYEKAREHALETKNDYLSFKLGAYEDRLYWRDGVLDLMIIFKTGIYHKGQLQMLVNMPETVIAALKGRRLAEVVDHPAFAKVGMTIKSVSADQGITLKHSVTLYPVEPRFA